jgi:vitamin B12 transporter
MTTAILLTLLGALSRLLPHPPNAVALGALALYSGARLPRRFAFAVPLASMALADVFLDAGTGRAIFTPVRVTVYATFAAIAAAGMLARRARPLSLAGLAAAGSVFFFATTNFAEWLGDPLYPKSLMGLAACYAAAIPFFWNTLAADVAGAAVLFGLDAVSRRSRALSRLRRSPAPLLLPLLAGIAVLHSRPSFGQVPPPAAGSGPPASLAESVVVTATLSPEEERQVGSATTVITRERIEASGAVTVLELLRSVPGLDVARQGTDGSVTSVFLRGAASTQTLVLVDGARVNSPFFAGYDFSALTTENVERIEIVRGPFSALYGSDAIGGVIQIFTRPAGGPATGRATLEGGSAGQRQGSAFVSAGLGPVGVAASFRDARVDGDRNNERWRERNGSFRLESRLGEGARVAVEGAILDGETGNPGPIGAENPSARGLFREERITVPVSFVPAPGHQANVMLASVSSKPSYRDAAGGFNSDTDARTLQGRASDTWKSGAQAVTAFASWDRWSVDDRSTFGTNLDGRVSSLWGGGVQDTIAFGAFTAVAGVRYDRHSEFGSAWSPRATLAWVSADALWKARASAGRAFRAPTVGELYYPFFGNPNLEPERSSSYELGAERYVGEGRVEVSLFWNDLSNLISPDFATSRNANIGRARTRGVEVLWRQRLLPSLEADATYTYLDAQDLQKGLGLLRRPRHRAALAVSWHPLPALTLSPRAVFVGARPDVDAVTFGRTESPSYTRVDLFARWELGHVAPYARAENLSDRRYAEVNGYPAPRRRWAGGVEMKF